MRRFILAFQFLTIIPVSKNLAVDEKDLGKSMIYFPLVGLILGGILICSDLGLTLYLPRSVVDGLLIVVLTILTGSLHLDALADTIDGIGSGKSRVEKLRIMKDSQIGAMGTVAICLVLITKYLCLSALPATVKYQAILAMLMISRWAQIIVAFFCEYAGQEKGLGLSFTLHTTLALLITASSAVIVIAFLILQTEGVIIVATVAVFCFLYSLYFKKVLGGATGDVLGAASEMVEIAVLLMILTLQGLDQFLM
jgi:adenosylcobinamide-GDP ribazoletransferase